MYSPIGFDIDNAANCLSHRLATKRNSIIYEMILHVSVSQYACVLVFLRSWVRVVGVCVCVCVCL